MQDKQEAYRFLNDLEIHLNKKLPDYLSMSYQIPEIVKTAKGDPKHGDMGRSSHFHFHGGGDGTSMK